MSKDDLNLLIREREQSFKEVDARLMNGIWYCTGLIGIWVVIQLKKVIL